MNLEARITELETRLAFQENAMQELSDVLALQQGKIELLQAVNKKLHSRIEELAENSPGDPHKEPPPPHY